MHACRALSNGTHQSTRLTLSWHRQERSALHMASAAGHAAVIKVLLEREADVDLEDEDGATPLCVAGHTHH